jgi:hypothetical protein
MEVRCLIHAPDALLRENAVCAHYIEGWAGHRAGMDALKKKKTIALTKMDDT